MDIISRLLGGWSRGTGIGAVALKIALSMLFSMIIGCERATKRHSAGLRTFMLVGLAATFATIADVYFTANFGTTTSAVVAAAVIGIALIGGNTILFSSKNRLKGLTTSVGLWANGMISVLIGLGQYTAAVIGFAALMCCISLFPNLENRFKQRSRHFEAHLELKSRNRLQEFMATIREFGLKIDEIEVNPAYANSGLGVYSVTLTIVGDGLKKKTHAEIINALSELDCVYYIEEME